VKKIRVFSGLFVALLFVVVAQTAMAQSTIFNIPSADTVDKGKGYFEFDFLPQAPGTATTRTYLYNPRLVVGLPGNGEVGVNFPALHTNGAPDSTYGYFQPNVKYKLYKNDDEGVTIFTGAVLNTPMNKRTGQDTWGYVYGGVAKKVKSGNYGPRITAGPYGVIAKDSSKDGVSFIGKRGGVILGYEQPIHPKVSIVADWFSTKNNLGYFTPGVSITLPASGLLNVGYSIGNDSYANSNATKNRYLFVYYGVTF
jgi:hypothetical protein